MKRIIAFALTLSIIVYGLTGDTTAADSGNPYYCPPGAKFCPLPGSNNTIAVDTHFGVDAKTGETFTYRGNVHPDEITNNLSDKEVVIMTVPSVNPENRYVPYPGAAPQPPPAAFSNQQQLAYRTQPQYPQAAPRQPAPQQPRALMAQPQRTSEVANQQATRSVAPKAQQPQRKAAVAQNAPAKDKSKKVQPRKTAKKPWWKGGFLRKKKDRTED